MQWTAGANEMEEPEEHAITPGGLNLDLLAIHAPVPMSESQSAGLLWAKMSPGGL